MSIFKIIEWISLNLDKVALIAVVIIVLSLTAVITKTLRSIKEGIKEGITPLGAFVLLVLIIIGYVVYKAFMSL
jgi:hypothetical protein